MNTTAMQEVVTDLTASVDLATLWPVVGTVVPIIAIAVLFALGYRILRRSTQGTAKGNVRM